MDTYLKFDLPKLSFAQPVDLVLVKQQEEELWQKWKDGGEKPEDMRLLLASFKPLIQKQAHQWVSSRDIEIPPEAIYAEFNTQFLNAMKTYNPGKGRLGSWVGTNLKKARRWVATYRHPARMGESRFYAAGKYDNAKAVLTDQLNREPATQEIADYMQWSPAEVSRLEFERRKSLPASGWEFDPATTSPSKEAEALRFAMHEFTPEEQLVAEYTLGIHGKPELKPMQIAKKIGVSQSKVSRVRKTITNKIERYMK